MKAALFLGCTVPVRAQNYEVSARRVAERLGIELVDLDGFGCCGYPIRSVSSRATLWMAARSLAIAEKANLDVVALCSACAATLAEARLELEHADLREEAQRVLALLGLRYEGRARIRHFARFLYEEIGIEGLRQAVRRPLTPLKLAVHYGCHYLKPSQAHQGPDKPESPHTIEEIIRAMDACVVPHDRALACCGGGVLAVRERAALDMARSKLDAVAATEAHAIVSVCPFCSVMYEGNQKRIEKDAGTRYNLPVLYLTQIIGMAFGIDPKDLGIKQNRVKPKQVLALLEQPS